MAPEAALHAQADYTLTILADAPNAGGAAKFVDFLLSKQGAALLKAHGVDVVKPVVSGNLLTMPTSVQAMVEAPAQ